MKVFGSDIALSAPKITLTGQSEVSMGVGDNVIKADATGVTIKGAKIAGTADGECHFVGGSVRMN